MAVKKMGEQGHIVAAIKAAGAAERSMALVRRHPDAVVKINAHHPERMNAASHALADLMGGEAAFRKAHANATDRLLAQFPEYGQELTRGPIR